MIMEITTEGDIQTKIFDPMNLEDSKKHDILMKVIDMINDRYTLSDRVTKKAGGYDRNSFPVPYHTFNRYTQAV